jgi:hypothetical protein
VSNWHIAIDRESEQQILDWLEQNAEQDTPMRKRKIKDYGAIQFQIKLA